jgi:hypothetical protein
MLIIGYASGDLGQAGSDQPVESAAEARNPYHCQDGTVFRDLIARLEPEATFAPGATDAQLDATESALGRRLPHDLAACLRESNGVTGRHGLGLIWSERIAADNGFFRTEPDFARIYMPFAPLVFFADGGNGDHFALLAEIDRDDVFVWNHEDDSRSWVAGNLATYLDWWITGRITI